MSSDQQSKLFAHVVSDAISLAVDRLLSSSVKDLSIERMASEYPTAIAIAEGLTPDDTLLLERLAKVAKLVAPEHFKPDELTQFADDLTSTLQSLGGYCTSDRQKAKFKGEMLKVRTDGWRVSRFKWLWIPADENFRRISYYWWNCNGRADSHGDLWSADADIRDLPADVLKSIRELSH